MYVEIRVIIMGYLTFLSDKIKLNLSYYEPYNDVGKNNNIYHVYSLKASKEIMNLVQQYLEELAKIEIFNN